MTKHTAGPESPVILSRGAWVRSGAILVWEPGVDDPQPQAPQVVEIRPADPIACPVCFARATQRCQTANGKRTPPHKGRMVRRMCECGGSREYHQSVCVTCLTRFDEGVVERLLDGERMDSTPAEKTEALRRWLETGGSERGFCRLHGWKHGRYTPKKQAA